MPGRSCLFIPDESQNVGMDGFLIDPTEFILLFIPTMTALLGGSRARHSSSVSQGVANFRDHLPKFIHERCFFSIRQLGNRLVELLRPLVGVLKPDGVLVLFEVTSVPLQLGMNVLIHHELLQNEEFAPQKLVHHVQSRV